MTISSFDIRASIPLAGRIVVELVALGNLLFFQLGWAAAILAFFKQTLLVACSR